MKEAVYGMELNVKKKTNEDILTLNSKNGVTFFTFPLLENTGLVRHAFSTRLGGVSRGDFASMNFSFTRGDEREAVLENYKRMADAIGAERERMVLTYQTHTSNIRRVTKEDAGKGVVRERDYRDVDGLITDVPDLTLVTFFADCVPLYFVDPVHRAIGLSHSGWRGTVKRMGRVTLEAMNREFGTRAEDVIACIGPSICQDCYEVGEEVIEEFKRVFREDDWTEIFKGPKLDAGGKSTGKYQLNLWKANELLLREAGIKKERLSVTNICTCCNPELLYSHRGLGERRGNLCAFLSLRS